MARAGSILGKMNRLARIALIIAGSAAASSIAIYLTVGEGASAESNVNAVAWSGKSTAGKAPFLNAEAPTTGNTSPTASHGSDPRNTAMPHEVHRASERSALASPESAPTISPPSGNQSPTEGARWPDAGNTLLAGGRRPRTGSALVETPERISDAFPIARPRLPAVPQIAEDVSPGKNTSLATGTAPKATDANTKPAAQTATQAARTISPVSPEANPAGPAPLTPSPMDRGHFTRNDKPPARSPRVWPKPFTPEEERFRQQIGVQAYMNLQHELATGQPRTANGE